VIRSFKHKGLRQLHHENDGRRLPPELVERIARVLHAIENANRVEELSLPTFKLHQLKGALKGYWSVTVRANWRIVFRFGDRGAEDVDFLDYH
jgi:proteic killer suppression protein